MQILGINRFDQCVINMAVINICNQESHVGKELRKLYNSWKEETSEAVDNPWLELHQFTIYIPHPEQQYEDVTLEEGLTKGYNIEVQKVENKTQLPYNIPQGGQFVIVLKQKGLDLGFEIAATGIFVRPLGVLNLDLIVDLNEAEYQSLIIKHPIIRDYSDSWEEKLKMFMRREIRSEELPSLVNYVDQTFNPDYRPPSWREVYLSASGFKGF